MKSHLSFNTVSVILDEDLQIGESTKQLFEVLRSSNLTGDQGENYIVSRTSVERSDIETDASPQDLETDDAREIPNVNVLRATRPSKKRVAFDLDQITFNIPGRTQLPPRLEKRELCRRSHSSGRAQRVNLSDPVDESQRKAILDAVDKNLTIIQGPPGTGKTQVAAIIVREWLRMESHAKVGYFLEFLINNYEIVFYYYQRLICHFRSYFFYHRVTNLCFPAEILPVSL